MSKAIERGLGDTSLFILWRRAVFHRWGFACAICGARYGLEVHHIVKRRVKLLRWNLQNGLPVCRECHGKHADLVAPTLIPEAQLAYLQGRRALTYKQYLFDRGLSENEFRAQVKAELLREINA